MAKIFAAGLDVKTRKESGFLALVLALWKMGGELPAFVDGSTVTEWDGEELLRTCCASVRCLLRSQTTGTGQYWSVVYSRSTFGSAVSVVSCVFSSIVLYSGLV